MNIVFFCVLTLLGLLAFALGVVQLLTLPKKDTDNSRKSSDPFASAIGDLFTVTPNNPEIMRRKKRAIWTICLSSLLLLAARLLLK